MYKKDKATIYVLKYDISKEISGEKDVSLYAEISDAPEHPHLGYYQLSIYLSVEKLGFRDFVIGSIFGHESMSREKIENYVDSYIEGQLNNTFSLLVQQMHHKSQLASENPFIPSKR